MNLTKTYSIQDIAYYNSGASVGSLVVGSGVSCTSNGSFITITTSTTGEKYVRLPVKLDGNWEYSIELAEWGAVNLLTFDYNNGSIYGALSDASGIVNLGAGSSSFSHSAQVGDVFTLTYINGTLTFYVNGNQKASRSVTLNTACGMYTNQNRIQKVKNIKLKQL